LNKEIFCTKCFNDNSFEKKQEVIDHDIRGDIFEIKTTKYICNNCGEEIIKDADFDNSLEKAYNLYRKKYNMLLPKEITEIRNKYDLSQRAFSRLLSWGQVTIHRYENGALQGKAHDQMLSFIKQPDNMLDFLQKNKNNISDELYKNVKEKAKDLLMKKSITDNIYVRKLQNIEDEFKGNRDFDIDKFCNMVLYFSQNIEKLWKTKLIKLIFYSEFLNFKNNNISIAGTPFVHWQLGPVPKHIYALLDILIEDYGVIKLEEMIEYYEGEIIENKKSFNSSLFSEEELETMKSITNHFKDTTASDIIDKTHSERAYQETIHNQLISYNYARDITI